MNALSEALGQTDSWRASDPHPTVRPLVDELLALLGLDERVAQRTRELRAANAGLERENRAEEALRESARKSRSLIDGIPGFVATLAPDGSVEAVNRQILEYTGHPLAELAHWGTNGIVHAEDMPNVAAVFMRAIAAGVPYEIEQRLRRHDGAYLWFSNRGVPAHDEAGKIVRWYVLLIDIDAKRRAEQALRESEREARLVMNSIPAGIGVWTPSGEIETVNEHMLRYFDKPEEELKRWRTADIVHPEDLERVIETVAHSIQTGAPFDTEERLLGPDGSYRWFQVRGLPHRDPSGRIVRWYALHIDIDERKRAEEALRASEVNLLKIINTLPTTAWSTRPDGYCDFLNQRWLDYAGYTAEEAVGWGWGAVIHPDDVAGLVSYWQACLASGTPVDTHARMRRFDGVYRWFLFRANPLRDEQGTIMRWYGTNIDIEDRKRAEEALGELRSDLAHMSRISSLGVLTASVAHEVSQPLSGIITNTNTCLRMLSANPPNVEGALETARRTMRDGNRASEVVGRLRALFEKKTAKNEEVDLNEAAAEVIALAASDLQRSRVVLRTEFASQLPPLSADRVQLQQVILNLLLNASDAMSSIDDRQRVAVIRTALDGDDVRLSVEDVGVGLSSENIERLFQAFYTTKSSGMGIGLSVSRSIIESHNGRLWGVPNDGPGATFSFSVPAIRAESRATA